MRCAGAPFAGQSDDLALYDSTVGASAAIIVAVVRAGAEGRDGARGVLPPRTLPSTVIWPAMISDRARSRDGASPRSTTS